MLPALWLVAGLGLLVLGAEALVRGAARLALALGVTPLVVGLTVVAFGTSAPEIAVTVQATLSGQSDLALGNVVGSNITTVLLILGLAAVIAPIVVAQRLVRLDIPLLIGVSLLLALNGAIGRWDGVLLLGGMAVYLVFVVRQSRYERAAVVAEVQAARAHRAVSQLSSHGGYAIAGSATSSGRIADGVGTLAGRAELPSLSITTSMVHGPAIPASCSWIVAASARLVLWEYQVCG